MKVLAVTLMLIIFSLVSCETEPRKPLPEKRTEAQEDTSVNEFKNLTAVELLPVLFDSHTVKNGIVSWEPDYEEKCAFPTSYDGRCHTVIDTIIHFSDAEGTKQAVVIFGTYLLRDRSSKVGDDCGSRSDGVKLGIATFSENSDGLWHLLRFKKCFAELGYWGTYKTTSGCEHGQISLNSIGNDFKYLCLKQGSCGHMGEWSGYEEWYQLEPWHDDSKDYYADEWHYPGDFSCIFQYYHYSSYGVYLEPDMELEVHAKATSSRTFLDAEGIPSVDLTTKGDGRKSVTQRFVYNQTERRFQLINAENRLDL